MHTWSFAAQVLRCAPIPVEVLRVRAGQRPAHARHRESLWYGLRALTGHLMRCVNADVHFTAGIVKSSMVDEVLLKMPVARVFIRIAISFLFWFVFQVIDLR